MTILGNPLARLDVLLLVFLGFCALWGAFRGFTTQVARLCTLFLGVGMARALGPKLAPFLQNHFSQLQSPFDLLIAYIAVFLGVCLVILMLSLFLKDVLKEMKLKKYDRLLGSGVGMLGGSFLAILVLSFVLMLFPQEMGLSQEVSQSKIASGMCDSLEKIDFVFPEVLRNALTSAIQKVRTIQGGGGSSLGGSSFFSETQSPIQKQQQALQSLLFSLNDALKHGRDPGQGLEQGLSQLLTLETPSSSFSSKDILSILDPETRSPQDIAEHMGVATLFHLAKPTAYHHSLMGANAFMIAEKENFLEPWTEMAIGYYRLQKEEHLRFVLAYPQGNAANNLRRLVQNLDWSKPSNHPKMFSQLLEVRELRSVDSFLIVEFVLKERVNFAQWIEEADLPFFYFK